MKNKIIDVIRRNRISSTQVSDALGKSGVLSKIHPLSAGHFVVGELFYTYVANGTNAQLHFDAQDLDEGSVLFVDSFGWNEEAILGDLVSKYCLLYKGASGIIVRGSVRDLNSLLKANYPIWSQGATPLGATNQCVENSTALEQEVKKSKKQYSGGVAVCDDTGVAIIPKHLLTQQTYESLLFIELQEDIWYFCIDTLKWSTFETIVAKRYLSEPEWLPAHMRQELEKRGLAN